MTSEELVEIENQLSFPTGQNGIQMAKAMNETNIGMTLHTIEALNLNKNNTVLEFGHGNCGHLEKILNEAKNIKYFGLEISETMQKEALKINKHHFVKNELDFKLYDGINIPFQKNYFDRIMTVNTIYFWNQPLDLITEVYRVLKQDGIFVITYAQRDFMESLPFVKNKFNLFNNQDIQELVKKTEFKLIEIIDKKDLVKSKIRDLVHRNYSIAILKKE